MDDMAVRMFALRLVVEHSPESRVMSPFALADAYYKWLKDEQKDAEKPKGSADRPVKTGRSPQRKR